MSLNPTSAPVSLLRLAPEAGAGRKRILALDGGGIRGIYTLRILARVEALLRETTGRADLRLADWFDFIGGTSTGAIIATALALGMEVEAIARFYRGSAAAIFHRTGLLRRCWARYDAEALARLLREVYGAETTLGSERVRTLLLLTLHNVTTDSPWIVTNHPRAVYNDRRRANCNLDLLLWQLVRAATAAPTFFPVEPIGLGGSGFRFEDGALTPFNNPAFQMFLTATAAPYRIGWPTGAEQLFVMSVGTGGETQARPREGWLGRHLIEIATSTPRVLIGGAQVREDLLCRLFGECRFGLPIDRECGDLLGAPAPGAAKLFRYVRYNAPLDAVALKACGVDAPLDELRRIDSIRQLDALALLGQAVADSQVRAEHWTGF
jgi:hypothetical protein